MFWHHNRAIGLMGVHAGNHRGKPEWGYRYQITPKARPLFFCARNCMTGQISFKSNFFSPLLYLFPYILSLRVYYAYFNFILLEENSMPLSKREYSSESDAVKGEMGGFLWGPAKVVILLRARSTQHGDQNGESWNNVPYNFMLSSCPWKAFLSRENDKDLRWTYHFTD